MDNTLVTTDFVGDDDNEDMFADQILDLINGDDDGSDSVEQSGSQSINETADGGGGDAGDCRQPNIDSQNKSSQKVLRLIDDNTDIFGVADKAIASGSANKNNNNDLLAKCVLEVFGGDISDDELAEDNNSHLTREGQLIESNLKSGNEQSSTSSSLLSSVSLFENKGNKNRQKNVWTENKKTTNENNNKLNDKTDETILRDVFSGIRLKNPLVSSQRMSELMNGRQMIKMSLIKSHINKQTNDIEGDWVTIGVIVNKMAPKTSKNGNHYSIWKLSDLKTKNVVSFFLFGAVHSEHWKLTVGTVVGLLNSRLMDNKMDDNNKNSGKYGNKNEICSLTIDHSSKLLVLGTAKDLGFCRAVKKNREVCGALINLATEDFCDYHIKNAYKMFSSRRSDIQMNFSNCEPNKYLANNSQKNNTFFANAFMDGERKDAPIIETKVMKSTELMAKKANENKTLSKVIKNPLSKAAKNFALSLSESTKTSSDSKTSGNTPFSAKDVFNSITKKETNSLGLKQFSVPVMAKGYKNGEMIDLSRKSDARLRAIQKLKQKPLEKVDPNKVKPISNKRSLDRIKSKIDCDLSVTDKTDGDANTTADEREAKAKKLRSELIDRALSRKSINEKAGDFAEAEAQEKYFNNMEKKEKIENKLSDIFEMQCQVVSCQQCKYTAHSASDLCKKNRHKLSRHTATKRFFRCQKCKHRSYTFNSLMPVKPCAKCGQISYAKTSIVDIKEETSLSDIKLKIRGEEQKFLNSMK
ncbi:protein MCM10 homolog [Oppia nitens]|uniref:protein MCM10 homolog n=1 Tax=Oppia nitens TaxID=1686743 RepID=UPI0023DB57FE|nr:protein MCM10 homolog [Oppia nitens]